LPSILDALHAGLVQVSAEVDLEQAVRGIDSLQELALHPLLHRALRAAGHGVFPEQRYPRDRGKRRRTEGARCDLVVTPDDRPLASEEPQLGLFSPEAPVAWCDALWIEVKVVAQFRELQPNPAYEHALQRPVWRDLQKLAADPGIEHGAALLILFTADLQTALHDLEVWAALAAEARVPVRHRELRSFLLHDRVGNRCCTLALFRIR
jgi:hypothetical protein